MLGGMINPLQKGRRGNSAKLSLLDLYLWLMRTPYTKTPSQVMSTVQENPSIDMNPKLRFLLSIVAAWLHQEAHTLSIGLLPRRMSSWSSLRPLTDARAGSWPSRLFVDRLISSKSLTALILIGPACRRWEQYK